jgi:hypothetical protein
MSVQIAMQLRAGKFPGQAAELEKSPSGGFFSYQHSTDSRDSGNSFFTNGAAYAQE